MDISRIAVSVSPAPVLSVEFRRSKHLYVWRVEILPFQTGSCESLAGELCAAFPQYLANVRPSQLTRLVRLASRLNLDKAPVVPPLDMHAIGKKAETYDVRVDFPSLANAKSFLDD